VPVVVEVADLTKNFTLGRGGSVVPVLRGITAQVSPGEFLAVVGPSGSGKSTLLYCMSGLEPASGGEVRLLGRTVGTLSRGALATLRRVSREILRRNKRSRRRECESTHECCLPHAELRFVR